MADAPHCGALQHSKTVNKDPAPAAESAAPDNANQTAEQTQESSNPLFPPITEAQTEPNSSTPATLNYDTDTVILLFWMMKNGFQQSKATRKSPRDVLSDDVKLAEQSHRIKQTVNSWQKKFTRIKQEYSSFISKLKQSGRDGEVWAGEGVSDACRKKRGIPRIRGILDEMHPVLG